MEREQATKFIYDLLRALVAKRGSDLFITAGFPPALKIDGKMTPVSQQALNAQAKRILRLFGPYGPGQVNRLVPRLIASVQSGIPVLLSRGGEPRINPIHVTDLVRVIVQAVEGSGSYTVNVAGPP